MKDRISKTMLREWTKNLLAVIVVCTICFVAIMDGKLYETLTAIAGLAAGFYFNTRGKNKEEVTNDKTQ